MAWKTLLHERGKLAAALAGVAFATGLVLAQSGLFVGFQQMATHVITRVGGDLWVMARGTGLIDFADPLSPGSRDLVAAHPCVARARGVVFAWATVRKPSGGVDNVQLIGFPDGPAAGARVMPWALAAGLPADLHAPLRVAVDAADLDRLEVPAPALGAELQLNDRAVYVGAVTRGIRSFTVVPYLFAEARNAQRIVGLAENQYTFWALDLRDPGCAAEVTRAIEASGDLTVHSAARFSEMTAGYWIIRSGAGATLATSALLGLLVGLVVVAQTLYSMTESRLRELATLKTMGATDGELCGYVAWQAGFLAVIGGLIGLLFAFGMRTLVGLIGLSLVLTPGVLAVGLGSICAMCGVAALASVRKVITLEAAAVFR